MPVIGTNVLRLIELLSIAMDSFAPMRRRNGGKRSARAELVEYSLILVFETGYDAAARIAEPAITPDRR